MTIFNDGKQRVGQLASVTTSGSRHHFDKDGVLDYSEGRRGRLSLHDVSCLSPVGVFSESIEHHFGLGLSCDDSRRHAVHLPVTTNLRESR